MNDKKPIESLECIDLSYCTILDKSFSGVKFNGASFRGTRFNNVDFTGASFQHCDFTESRMTDCDLSHVCAADTDFSLTIFESCIVDNMQLNACRMEAVSPYSTELSEISMDDATRLTMSDQDEGFGSMKGGM